MYHGLSRILSKIMIWGKGGGWNTSTVRFFFPFLLSSILLCRRLMARCNNIARGMTFSLKARSEQKHDITVQVWGENKTSSFLVSAG